MKRIKVSTAREYHILVGNDVDVSKEIIEKYSQRRVAVFSDSNVFEIYGKNLQASLAECYEVSSFVVPAGEASKNIDYFSKALNFLAENRFTRNDIIVALGGGVVGDLAGFVAACYMRGMEFVMVPTTLLSQVDSSVGGKTAVNITAGKNLVGAFWQPSMVLINTSYLKTLPQNEYISGSFEVIKTAAIKSAELFCALEKNALQTDIEKVVASCCAIKAQVVANDEQDFGERMLLNFGHTFGHAIEASEGYKGLSHGEAVGAGMLIAAEIGARLGITPKETVLRLKALINATNCNLENYIDKKTLLKYIELDKKQSAMGLNFIVLSEIGAAKIVQLTQNQLQELI